MGLFDRFYYGKAGQKDYTEMDMPKNRVSLFFLVFKDHLFDLMKVNLLQIVFWIPFLLWTYINFAVLQSIDSVAILEQADGARELINTMASYLTMWLIGLIPCVAITGPSSAGAAYIMRNWARDQHAFLFSDFKDAFKSNWKQALAVSVITGLVPILAYTAVAYYGQMASNNLIMIVPLIIVLSATVMWVLMLPLLYPLMVGYELRFRDLLKNAFLMAAASLPHMLLSRLLTFVPIAIAVGGMYVGNGLMIIGVLAYYMLFGFSLSRLIYASVGNGIFDKYLNPRIEGASVGMGLRPQTEDDMLLDEDEDDEDESDNEP